MNKWFLIIALVFSIVAVKSQEEPFLIDGLLMFFINAPKVIFSLKDALIPISMPIEVDLDSGNPKVPSPFGPADPA